MTEAQRIKFHSFVDKMDKADAAKNLKSYENMCGWLRQDHYSFYIQVKDSLRELWNEIKSTVNDILEGAVLGVTGMATAPIIGVYAGVKEGLENGVEAGVKKGFKAMGKFLDDLFS